MKLVMMVNKYSAVAAEIKFYLITFWNIYASEVVSVGARYISDYVIFSLNVLRLLLYFSFSLSRRFCQLVLYFVLRFFHVLGFTLLFVCFGLVNYFSLVQVQFACVEV